METTMDEIQEEILSQTKTQFTPSKSVTSARVLAALQDLKIPDADASQESVRSNKSSKEKLNKLDESAIVALDEMYGPRIENIDGMDTNFIAKLENVCDLGPFPAPILLQLIKSGLNTPHKVINTFGGGIMYLAKQLVYMKLSLFIEEFPTFTRRLFAISRLILGINFTVEIIFPQLWSKTKKTAEYDRQFNNLSETEVLDLHVMSQDDHHEAEIMLMFNTIKKCAIDLTNPINNPDIFEITSNASKRHNNDDSSTIRSTKVPTAISTQDETQLNQFVTERKVRINDPESRLKSNRRRVSGHSKAKSPMDFDFHPHSNDNTKEVLNPIPNENDLFMAGITQHSVQNQQGSFSHPQQFREQIKNDRGGNSDNDFDFNNNKGNNSGYYPGGGGGGDHPRGGDYPGRRAGNYLNKESIPIEETRYPRGFP